MFFKEENIIIQILPGCTDKRIWILRQKKEDYLKFWRLYNGLILLRKYLLFPDWLFLFKKTWDRPENIFVLKVAWKFWWYIIWTNIFEIEEKKIIQNNRKGETEGGRWWYLINFKKKKWKIGVWRENIFLIWF